jgi:hypothetical protein
LKLINSLLRKGEAKVTSLNEIHPLRKGEINLLILAMSPLVN